MYGSCSPYLNAISCFSWARALGSGGKYKFFELGWLARTSREEEILCFVWFFNKNIYI